MWRWLGVIGVGALTACSAASGQGSARVVGRSVCVDAADTVDLGPGQQQPAADAVPGCRTWPRSDLALPAVRGMCGPCGFSFDRATTLRERASRPTTCCYEIASPPPPG